MITLQFENDKSTLKAARMKIISIGLCLSFVFVFFSGFISYKYVENTKKQRLEHQKQTVQIARNSIEPILVRYRSQQLGIFETLNQVRNLVRRMTYSDHVGNNYIFMSAYDGIMLVQPFEPEKEMTDMWNLKDSNGVYIIRALVKIAKSERGYGYISYHYKRPGTATPEEKISFVMGIPELGCYIGTGQYVGDLRNGQIAYITQILILTSTLLIFLFALVWISMKVISKQNEMLYKENKALMLAEKSLRETEKFLKTVINNIPHQIFWKNKDLDYLGCNRHFSNVIGLDHPQKIKGMTDYDFNKDKTRAESCRKCEKQIINSRKSIIDLEENYHNEDGNQGTVLTSKVPVYDDEGNCICIVGICTDITPQKKAEQAREKLQNQLNQAQKMESVGRLASGMAHEINNPLAGVIQNASVLENRLTNPTIPANIKVAQSLDTTMDSISEFMEKRGIPRILGNIKESGIRMAIIVDNMLSFARNSDSSLSTHDPVALMDKILELASADYDLKKHYDFKSISIEKEYENNLPMVVCESSKIQQVILNVLNNGAYAMFETLKNIRPKFVLRLNREQASNMLRIEIQDNGPGMDANTAKRIFEPFFTTKPVGVGTGLGLSVSYFIITENHKGSMDVISELGIGSTFIIRLPLG